MVREKRILIHCGPCARYFLTTNFRQMTQHNRIATISRTFLTLYKDGIEIVKLFHRSATIEELKSEGYKVYMSAPVESDHFWERV